MRQVQSKTQKSTNNRKVQVPYGVRPVIPVRPRSYLDIAKLIKKFYVRPNIDSGAPYGVRPVIPVRPRSYLDFAKLIQKLLCQAKYWFRGAIWGKTGDTGKTKDLPWLCKIECGVVLWWSLLARVQNFLCYTKWWFPFSKFGFQID